MAAKWCFSRLNAPPSVGVILLLRPALRPYWGRQRFQDGSRSRRLRFPYMSARRPRSIWATQLASIQAWISLLPTLILRSRGTHQRVGRLLPWLGSRHLRPLRRFRLARERPAGSL